MYLTYWKLKSMLEPAIVIFIDNYIQQYFLSEHYKTDILLIQYMEKATAGPYQFP